MMSFTALSAALLLAAPPQCEVTADWQVRVTLTEPAVSAVLDVPPSPILTVTGERYDRLPTFNPNAGGWTKGAGLRGVKAQECTVRHYLVPDSLVVASSADADAVKFEQGKDYEADLEWGTVGRLEGGRIGANTPVCCSYRHGIGRIDSVVLTGDGKLALRVGTPNAATPARPDLQTGDKRLANLWLPGKLAKLTLDNWLPVLEDAYPEPPKPNPTQAERFLPKSLAKLRGGEPIRILAWGDSVTDAGYLPDPAKQRWQAQFVARLQERFPKAQITLINNGWGGRNISSFLAEPPGSKFNYQETVLGAKPDLVVSEFVNDAYLDPAGVEKQYSKVLADFQAIGAEWLILTPHYVRPDWMGLSRERDIDADPRPYVAGLRQFAPKHNVALADAAIRWGRLWRQGLPYSTLFMNGINHPNPVGMRIFADALMEVLP